MYALSVVAELLANNCQCNWELLFVRYWYDFIKNPDVNRNLFLPGCFKPLTAETCTHYLGHTKFITVANVYSTYYKISLVDINMQSVVLVLRVLRVLIQSRIQAEHILWKKTIHESDVSQRIQSPSHDPRFPASTSTTQLINSEQS